MLLQPVAENASMMRQYVGSTKHKCMAVKVNTIENSLYLSRRPKKAVEGNQGQKADANSRCESEGSKHLYWLRLSWHASEQFKRRISLVQPNI